MSKFSELLGLKNYENLMNYCEVMSVRLCDAIRNNRNDIVKQILEEAIEDCDYIRTNVDSELDDIKLKLFIQHLQKEFLHELCRDIKHLKENTDVINETRRKIAEFWIYASIYSFIYAIYNMGFNLQSIVYNPELLSKIDSDEAQHILELYSEGYLAKNSFSEENLNRLLELKLCSIDNKSRVFLTNLGLTMLKMDGERIRRIATQIKVRTQIRHKDIMPAY